MTPQIKQRIEQIKAGQVPEGYKKTKIGIVPTEWEETKFKKMFSRLNRKNSENNDNVLTISAQYGLISQSEFFNKSIASEDKSNYFLLHKGEYAYNKSYSNGYPYGALKRLEKYEKGIVSPLYICFSATADNKCPEYYSHYFEGGLMNREIKAFAQEGARNHGLLNISVDDFFNSYLIQPSTSEQEKIVEILSAQDKVIELKEKLLVEKRKQKKYLMQQLLTGKIRTGDFPQLWETKKLGILCNISTGKLDANAMNDNGLYPFYTCAAEIYRINTYAFDTEALIVSGNGANVGYINYYKGKFNAYQRTYVLDKFEADILFIKYILELFLRDRIEREKNAGNTPYIKISALSEMSINIPCEQEQKRITRVLANADKTIELLQEEIFQEKQKKKALMQLLLTGIVRVEVNK